MHAISNISELKNTIYVLKLQFSNNECTKQKSIYQYNIYVRLYVPNWMQNYKYQGWGSVTIGRTRF